MTDITPEQFAANLEQLAAGGELSADEELREKLQQLNSVYAVINWRGRTLVMSRPPDPVTGGRTLQLSSIADFRSWFANKGRVGKQSLADWWLEHPQRVEYRGMVFMPAGDAPGFLNLWSGWAVTAGGAQEKCQPWLDMVKEVICSGDEELYKYVIAWCADAVQNITERPGVTLVLLGKQGTGKGTFAREFGALFGEHFLHIRHSRLLTGNFNGHLTNALMVFADEAVYPGDKQSEGALKGMITEPTIPIEYKGKDVVTVQNHIRVIMASNHAWVVPAALDDRRFCVIEVNETHRRDEKYFERVRGAMANGGREALLEYLLKFDLKGVRLRDIPETEARHEQQVQSMDPFQAFWFERLMERQHTWDGFVKLEEVIEEYREMAGKFPLTPIGFGMRTRKMFPGTKVVRPKSVNRARYYKLPELATARKQFELAAGRLFKWAAEEAAETDDIVDAM